MNKIRELRKQAGLTQGELAKKLQTTTSNISGWECGKWQPDNQALLTLADVFNVTVDELLDRQGVTAEEYAAGARATVKKSITPIEDDMLYAFRKVGEKLGEKGQRALIDVAEGMAGLK